MEDRVVTAFEYPSELDLKHIKTSNVKHTPRVLADLT